MTRRNSSRPDRAVLRLWQLEDRTVPAGGVGASTAPTANDDFTDTDGNNPVTINVLANDAGASGATLNKGTVTVTQNPPRGTVAVDPATGEVTYTATGFFQGTDSFKYTVRDSNNQVSNAATVTVVVNRPTANDDFADTDGNNPVEIDLLANDTDPDGNGELDPATVRVVGTPANGNVVIDPATGKATFTAVGFVTGTVRFQYTVTDRAGAESAPGTVTVVINRPTANGDYASTTGTTPVTVNVLANDTDPDGDEELDTNSVKVVSGPALGSVAIDGATGAITYTPFRPFIGLNTFAYTVTDFPGAESAPGVVKIKVNPSAANQFTAAGADAGGSPRVTLINPDGSTRGSFYAYDAAFTGGVRVAVGDVNGDGVPDVITAPGAGGGPNVRVFDGRNLSLIHSFFAYDPSFLGGVNLAAADVDGFGDGRAEIVTGAGAGGGPNVRVFSYVADTIGKFDGDIFLTRANFFAYDAAFLGGVYVAAGDVDGDGRADIVTGAGPGGGPNVKVFGGPEFALEQSFFAYDALVQAGITVAVGDVNRDGIADIITGVGAGVGPNVKVFDGATGDLLRSVYAYAPDGTTGVRVAAADLNLDGTTDLVFAPGSGADLPLVAIDGGTGTKLNSPDPFGAFAGGVFVGGLG